MPLNHIAGRVTLYQTLAKGGATTFVRRADMSTLFEDLARARPTSLLLVPRISNMVYGERFSYIPIMPLLYLKSSLTSV